MTDLTKASEARERLLDEIHADLGSERVWGARYPTLLDAYAEAVRSDTLADVAARLPEALDKMEIIGWVAQRYGRFNRAYYDKLTAAILAHLTGGTDR